MPRPKEHHFELEYPGIDGNPTHLTVGLSHVRAADEIRISYDFERDGWVVEQAQIFAWDNDATGYDPRWKEVAFVAAWASATHNDIDPSCPCDDCAAEQYVEQTRKR